MLLFAGLFCAAPAAAADEAVVDKTAADKNQDREGIAFFEKKIRPALVKHCYACHSAAADAEGELQGGLRLDTRQGAQSGGDTGPAVVPGDLAGSLLVESIRYGEDAYQMPPDGKLPAAVIADFEKWVAIGAPDPRQGPAAAVQKKTINWEEARRFWSFQPPALHPRPAVRKPSWPKNKIDAFILARLEAAGLSTAPPANRNTLLRRACFDLTGLPPTPEQVEQFLTDDSPAAYAALLDRLLDSPAYGERWGRHWLDVARYSEDNTNMGPFNGPYKNAWRYRDWVVQALNHDTPYDQFIVRQLATDFLPETGPEDYAALGFQGLAPSYHKEVALAQLVLENRYADEWEDRVDAIGRGLLGLTLACARCHDHKYAPVTTSDYYALAGVFASCRQTPRPIISDEEVAKTQAGRDQAAKLEKSVAAWEKENKARAKKITELTKKLKEKPAKKEKSTESKAAAESSDLQKTQEQIANLKQQTELKKQTEESKQKITAAKAEIEKLKKTPGFVVPMADALTEEQVRVEEITKDKMKIVYYANKPRDLNVFIRGDASRLGEPAPRRFLQVLSPEGPQPFTNGSGRLELARAIASRENPLTARVIVNRVWAQHFGRGLVESPSDFGATGSLPSHPELLDDLAVRFLDANWSLKWLHREIMLSATYRQSASSANSPEKQKVDAENRLLSHFNRRRLDAEAFRDAVLAVSGELDRSMGGPSGDADDAGFRRRTIYSSVSRHKLSDTLQTFDFPDPAIHCAQRALTTTPLQQMFVLNSPFMHQQSEKLAQRLHRESATVGAPTLEDQVRFAHRLLFGRQANADELEIARHFIGNAKNEGEGAARWQRYTHALLSSNAFMYVD